MQFEKYNASAERTSNSHRSGSQSRMIGFGTQSKSAYNTANIQDSASS